MKTRGVNKYTEKTTTQYYTRKDNKQERKRQFKKKRQENEISEERANFKGWQDGKAKTTRGKKDKTEAIHLGLAVVSYQ